MSREEAASIYLDRLLGFRSDYKKFRQAEAALSEEETSLLQSAVTGWARDDSVRGKNSA